MAEMYAVSNNNFMNIRKKSLLDDMKTFLFQNERRISLERAILFTKSHKQTEGEPQIIRRAKATAYILDHVKISIRPGELLVGNRTVRPRSGILSPEMDPYWIMKEMDTIHDRPQDAFDFTEADKRVYREQLLPYWSGRSMKDFINGKIPKNAQKAVDDLVIKLNQTDKGQGHIIMDFQAILNHGVGYYIDLLSRKSAAQPENNFFIAAKVIFEAMVRHFLRYRKEALQKAKSTEITEARKVELLEMADMCKRLSSQKPQSFYEALQLLWMTSIVGQYESNASSLSLGRMDQYLYPFSLALHKYWRIIQNLYFFYQSQKS